MISSDYTAITSDIVCHTIERQITILYTRKTGIDRHHNRLYNFNWENEPRIHGSTHDWFTLMSGTTINYKLKI